MVLPGLLQFHQQFPAPLYASFVTPLRTQLNHRGKPNRDRDAGDRRMRSRVLIKVMIVTTVHRASRIIKSYRDSPADPLIRMSFIMATHDLHFTHIIPGHLFAAFFAHLSTNFNHYEKPNPHLDSGVRASEVSRMKEKSKNDDICRI